jgi:hypothetical protein
MVQFSGVGSQRRIELGEAVRVGSVIHRFSDFVVGARMSVGSIITGDELVILHKQSCQTVKVASLQIGETPYEKIDLAEGQEIGIKLTARANEGAELIRVSPPQQALLTENLPERISPDDYPLEVPTEAASEAQVDSEEGT